MKEDTLGMEVHVREECVLNDFFFLLPYLCSKKAVIFIQMITIKSTPLYNTPSPPPVGSLLWGILKLATSSLSFFPFL